MGLIMEMFQEFIKLYQEGLQQQPTVIIIMNIIVVLLVIQILLTSCVPYLQKRLDQDPDYEEAKNVRISINYWMIILLIAICIIGPNPATYLSIVGGFIILIFLSTMVIIMVAEYYN